MNKTLILCLMVLIIISPTISAENINKNNLNLKELFNLGSIRKSIEDVIIIPDSNPFFGIIGSYIACWYNSNNNSTGLLPLLVQHNEKLTDHQEIFLDQYLKNKDKKLLVIGKKLNTKYDKTEIPGCPPIVAVSIAKHVFKEASNVIIIPYDTENAYQLSLIASPLASYLNIPILIYDENQLELQDVCDTLNTTNAFVIGDLQLILPDITITILKTKEDIQNTIIKTIKEQFNDINYITITNPSDTIPLYLRKFNATTYIDHITNIKLTILGKEINLIGTGFKKYNISIPKGINRIQIYGNILKKNRPFIDKINPIDPKILMNLYDPHGNTVAYSNSLAYDIGKIYLETLTSNASGNYTLVVKIYNGLKGGFFIQRGISLVNNDFEISINISTLEKPHMPLIPKLSITAPYLTSAHGGILIADSDFEITSDDYAIIANGSGTGPWYNKKLHNFTNQKVNYTIGQLENTLSMLYDNNMLNNYLNGPAWLAILGGTNMIPMYYYGPSQQGLAERGLPSDNLYSLDWNLSVGRIIGWNVQDVSLLISRTLFYKDICGQPTNPWGWHNRFSFIFGEGFGETGGIFHQIPYSIEIRKYGFKPRVFGVLRNSRQIGILFKTYTGSNYIEYLGHADWFWFTPSLYGLDYFSKAIDVSHAKDWIFTKPSIFLTSACLMGRIDGIPPQMNIGLTMLHAGCNCFIGATRETGSEAGLTIFENHLIIDDLSVGEALRGEKRVDQELPTFYVRTLFGDPAFNPYEPNNGFSDQGRPILLQN
jgi:hypothetical protein